MNSVTQGTRASNDHRHVVVSVLIATFNRANALERAVQSVLGQSLAQIEVIVVDDASSDETPNVLNRLRETDFRVRSVRHPQNLGLSAARNTALALSTSRYLAFLDDDDVWIDSEKLERQVAAFQDDPRVGIVCTGVRIYSSPDTSSDFSPSHPADLRSHILVRNGIIFTSTVMVSRQAINSIGQFDTKMKSGVDSDLYRRYIVNLDGVVKFLPTITTGVYTYSESRMTSDQSARANLARLKSHLRVIRKHSGTFVRHPRVLIGRLSIIARLSARIVAHGRRLIGRRGL